MAKKPMTKDGRELRYFTKALTCPDGSRKYIRGKTKAELDRKVREAQAQLGMGININDDTTVAELAQTWVDIYKRPSIKPQSLVFILGALNNHIVPAIGQMKVRDVKPADCAKVLIQATDCAKSTKQSIRSKMKEMFDVAIENNIIVKNPVTKSVKPSGAPPERRVPLTSEQMDKLCKACLVRSRVPRMYTFVLLCGYAGLRASEALGLNLKNVDLKRGVIHVREQYFYLTGRCGTTPELKTPASKRDLPIPPILLAHLSHLQPMTTDGYIFNIHSMSLDTNYSTGLARICDVDKGGIPKGGHRKKTGVDIYVHPHLLRHTYATRCFEAGMDIKEVQYLLGHSSPNLTMDIYVHYLAGSRQEDTARKVADAFPGTNLAVLAL